MLSVLVCGEMRLFPISSLSNGFESSCPCIPPGPQTPAASQFFVPVPFLSCPHVGLSKQVFDECSPGLPFCTLFLGILPSFLISLLLEVAPSVPPGSSKVSNEAEKKLRPPTPATLFPGIPLSSKEFLCEAKNLSLGISVQVFLRSQGRADSLFARGPSGAN